MTEQELERRLKQALDAAAPNDLDKILSRCAPRTETVVPFHPKQRHHTRALIAAYLTLVLIGGAGGVFYQRANAVASVVSLDVNPSIELKVNQKEKVLACTPLNQEAEAVLSDMGGGADLKGTKLEVAVNAVVGALVSRGYLDSLSSAIMISVEDQDQDRAFRLRQELTGTVDAVLQSQSSGAAILSQTVDASDRLEQQAMEHHISTGKANLVNQVIAQNDNLSFDMLAQLTIEELNDLIQLGSPAMPIGIEQAAQIVREAAGAFDTNSVAIEVDPELDEDVPHYEVELSQSGHDEREYWVDAFTGEILIGDPAILPPSSPAEHEQSAPENSSSVGIGPEQARNIALTHAGVSESQVSGLQIQHDQDDGHLEYEVEFCTGSMEYEYTIDGSTGKILKYDCEQDD
ncbi:MAG: PepSY domain-containing protein [Oscillospiraceae bacterium]|nr:PepSY domain-containing protein [Oscillospiraceae bacterium]